MEYIGIKSCSISFQMPQETSEALEVMLQPAGVGVLTDTPDQGQHSFEKNASQYFLPASAFLSLSFCPLLGA